MKMKKLGAVMGLWLGLASYAMAAPESAILLTADQPGTKITYQLAHKNMGGETIFSDLLYAELHNNLRLSMDFNGYSRVGLVLVSVNGHQLPPDMNRFDQAKQCSMTTDSMHATGALQLNVSEHAIKCSTYGGVFG